MADTLLTRQEVMQFLGVSETTLWRMVKKEQFPPAIKLTPQCLRWKKSQIDKYISSKCAA
ncbi:AlpA family phage regulatory protein [Acetobacteraceae bacterium]|nr:AlpA family phage regulatory protein [Acetobacteraceae bacterium]